MDFVGMLSNGLLGGLTGIVGSSITAFVGYKQKKLELAHEERMEELTRETMQVEAKLAVEKQQVMTEGQIAVSEMDALTESYKEAFKPSFKESYMQMLPQSVQVIVALAFAFVDFIRRLMRPAITTTLMVVAWQMTMQAINDKALISSVGEMVVNSVIYLVVTAVSWWFADRRLAKGLAKAVEKRL